MKAIIVIDNESSKAVICAFAQGDERAAVYHMTTKTYEQLEDAVRDCRLINGTPIPKPADTEAGSRRRSIQTASDQERRQLADHMVRYSAATSNLDEKEIGQMFKRLPWAKIIEVPGGFFYTRQDFGK